MKSTITFFVMVMISINLFGQSYPDCSNLTVENIQMDNDTANLMKITISNDCSTCLSGINGCVYGELRVIKTVVPFDTIAASNCYCLQSPDNNAQKTYSIPSTVTSLPSISDIRVSFLCGGTLLWCDTIPFSPTLGISANEFSNSIRIYPNPNNGIFNLQMNTFFNSQIKFELYNMLGKKVLQSINQQLTNSTIDISLQPNGIYFYQIKSDKKEIARGKIIKQ